MTTYTRGEDADRLRRMATDPQSVCRALGLLDGQRGRDWLGQAGGGVMVRCPWHNERSPSCSVRVGNDGTLAVHCHGCARGGNVFHLTGAVHRLTTDRDFPQILEHVAAMCGTRLEDVAGATVPRRTAAVPIPVLHAKTFDRIAQHVARHGSLASPGAAPVARYLEARGLLERATAHGWLALPTGRDLQDLQNEIIADVGPEDWQLSGLANLRGEFTWTDHRLVIPWRDTEARVVTLQRRLLRTSRGAKEPKYVIPRGRKCRLYGVERVASMGPAATVVYTEGPTDALAFELVAERQGLDVCVLAVQSASTWDRTFAHHAMAREAWVAADGDTAGEGAAAQWTADLRGVAMAVKRVRPRNGAKDWSEVWLAASGAAGKTEGQRG